VTALRSINCAEATDRAAFFVLGALDTREALEVREHLETCSRAHEEFAEIGGVVPHLAEFPDELEPAPELRQRLLDAVDADVRARRREYDAAERLVASFGARPRAPQRDNVEAGPVAVGPGRPAEVPGEAPEDAPAIVSAASTERVESNAVMSDAAEPIGPTTPADTLGVAVTADAFDDSDGATSSATAVGSPGTLAVPVTAVSATGADAVGMPASVADAGIGSRAIDVPSVRERAAARERGRGRSAGRWLLAAAAAFLLIGLGAWNVMLVGQMAETREHLRVMQAALVAQSAPNAIVAVLEGTPAAPGASGTAVMAPGKPGYLIVRGLEPAEAGKAYQAWYLAGNQARSAGLLKVGSDGIGVLEGLDPSQPADAIAVTLEREGGVERSSQQPLVYGKVTGKPAT
jgi:hypothetical protein